MKTPLESVSISGTAQEGQTLTANVAPTDATVTYKWKQSDDSGSQYSDISEAVSKTFVPTSQQVGKTLVCECTGTGKFKGTKQSAATSAVVAASL